MNMVAKDEPRPIVLPQQNETAAILSMVARAASDPNVDIDKFERIMQMQERAMARQSQVSYDDAMAAMQPELPVVGERGDANGRYTFALWEDINAAIKPILQRHGFALTFRTSTGDGITVTGILSHRMGHREETSITLPSDPSGNKNAVQAVASSVSYGKRYTAQALLNLTSHGEDDDAYAGGGGFDASGWADGIRDASSMDDLNRIAADLKTHTTIPAPVLKKIRALWAARAKELK